ncbi:MAG: hypothetical protein ACRDPK_20455, partial [Carbonactinosporaceae bacterium]
AHPAGVARELARGLPRAQLRVLPEGGAWGLARHRIRDEVSAFLNAPRVPRRAGSDPIVSDP